MRRAVTNVILAGGFFAVTAAIGIARRSPADSYEPSIYTGTPTGTWAALAIAFAVAVVTILSARGWRQALGIGLGTTAVTTIVSLPMIRGYRFLGMGDGLTHLGWTRDILTGTIRPHELFYPGLHSITTAVTLVGGIPLERAMMVSVVALFVPFLVFIPLVVRDMTGRATAVGFGAIVSWFVLPINNVSTHLGPHTNSNALFLVPVVLFAVVAYMRRQSGPSQLPLGVSPFGLLVFLIGIGLLLVHPQQLFNVVVLFGAISVIQLVSRWRSADTPIAAHTAVTGQTAILGGLFVLWVSSNERFRRAVGGLLTGLLSGDIGTGSEVGQRGSSLTEIGGSLGELFVKMFLVSALVGTIAALFLLLTWLGRTRVDAETRTFLTYFGVALVPLGGIFLVYFVGTPTMAFRQVGFIYVLLTILGAVAIGNATTWLGGWITAPGGNAVAASVVGVCLALSLATMFGSPLIYSPTQHVTDQNIHGYDSTFDHAVADVPLVGFGFGVTRYTHAIDGTETEDRPYAAIPDAEVDPDRFNAGDYPAAYPSDRYYFIVTSYDEYREFAVYDELHHEQDALAGVDDDPATEKVLTNGEYRVYVVSESG